MFEEYFKENYKISEKIGEGSFGQVFLTKRNIDNKSIALKYIIIKGDNKHSLTEKVKSAEMEISILQKLSQPECIINISCYYNHKILIDKKSAHIFLEMEYINGFTL